MCIYSVHIHLMSPMRPPNGFQLGEVKGSLVISWNADWILQELWKTYSALWSCETVCIESMNIWWSESNITMKLCSSFWSRNKYIQNRQHFPNPHFFWNIPLHNQLQRTTWGHPVSGPGHAVSANKPTLQGTYSRSVRGQWHWSPEVNDTLRWDRGNLNWNNPRQNFPPQKKRELVLRKKTT